jgi:hypothetical protein
VLATQQVVVPPFWDQSGVILSIYYDEGLDLGCDLSELHQTIFLAEENILVAPKCFSGLYFNANIRPSEVPQSHLAPLFKMSESALLPSEGFRRKRHDPDNGVMFLGQGHAVIS